RSHPAAAWTALEAGAAQTAVVSLPQYREAMPPEVAEHVAAQSTEKELRGEVNARIWQTELRDREALRLHRAVLAGHTYDHRARSILGALGKTTERPSRSVSAVAPTNRAHEIGNIFDNMGRQAYPELELVLVLHGLDVDDAELQAQAADKGVKNLTIVHADKSLTLGMCMNRGIEAASGAYIAKIDDDNFYGKHYLTDLMAAFDYTDAGVVGKWGHYVWLRSTDAVVLRYPDAEHTYERRIQGGSMLIEGDLARSLKFSDIPRAVDSDFLDRAIADGVRIYSGDRFNFVSVRGSDRTSHTWQVHDVTFMTKTGGWTSSVTRVSTSRSEHMYRLAGHAESGDTAGSSYTMSSLKRRMKETVLKAAYPVAVRIPPTVGPAKVRRLNACMRVSKALRLIRQKQDYAKAEAIAQPLIGTPAEAGAWHVRAVAKQKQADLTGALEDIRKAIELDPTDLDAQLVHFRLAGQTQRTAEQREVLERLAVRPPRHGGEVRKTLDALAEGEDADLVAQYDKVLQGSAVSYEPERVRELEEQLRLIQLYRSDQDAY